MRGENKKNNRWKLTAGMMMAVLLVSCMIMKFNIQVAITITLVQGLILVRYGEKLETADETKHLAYLHIYFDLIIIITTVIAFYLIGQACYNMEEAYFEWLFKNHKKSLHSIDLEIGTLLLVNCFIFIGGYRKVIWKHMKTEINKWLPSSWTIIAGCCLMLFSRDGVSHAIRVSTLFIGAGLLITQLIYQNFISKEQRVKFYLNPKAYLRRCSFIIVAVWMIGNYLPEYQELPGARWIRNMINSWGAQSQLHQKIPYEISLNNDISVSNAVLFEVEAVEPLYLREIAYTQYADGKWKIPEGEHYESYIDLKFDYLEAEYEQTSVILDEIAFQNSQDSMLLSEYAKMANYESTIIRKKSYTVLQNPIDKISYFTVNGFYDIKDANSNTVYYYQNLNNCYFHSESIVEPSNYEVDYYDRIPRVGSREYAFLKSINSISWEAIYEKIIENRRQYHLYNENVPRLLFSYSPMIQYQNAKEKFLQIPDKLKQPLKELSNQVITEEVSDWDKAEKICEFLKQNYQYHLRSKRIEGERVTHFLFKEKEGICQDFATSMTLMCRSIGIPAKYVTGYLVTEKNENTGNYIVREKNAHAFVEVYIAGYGWMTFDPTPGVETVGAITEKSQGLRKEDYMWAAALILVIGICLAIYNGGLVYLKEAGWILTFKLKKTNSKLSCLIKKELFELDKRGLGKWDYETLSEYQERLAKEDIYIKQSISFYEKQRYGGISPDKQEINRAYEEYKTLKVKLKGIK